MSEPFLGAAVQPTEIQSLEIANLLEETPWTIALIAQDGQILALSQALLAMMAAPEGELLGQPLTALVLEAERDALRSLFAQAGAGGRPPTPIKVHLRRSGRVPIAAEIKAIAIPDDRDRRVTLIIDPLAMQHRREQMIIDFNLLASNLLAAQSPSEVYERATAALQPLGMGMLVAWLEPGDATLRVDYIGIGAATTSFLRRAAQIDFTKLRVPAGAPLFAEVLARQTPFFNGDFGPLITALLAPPAAAVCRALLRVVGLSGCILAPLLAGEKVHGVLMIWSHMLSNAEVPFIGAFAHQIGAVLAQIKLRRQMEMQVQQLNSLAATARAVTTLGSLDDVLRVICVQAQELLGAQFARIAAIITGTDTIKYIMSTGLEAENLLNMSIPIDRSISGTVLRTGKGRCVADIQIEPDIYPPARMASSARSVLYQPLQHQGAVIGVLIVGHTEVGHFSQTDLDYLAHYAEYAAVAITNAQLHNALRQSELEQQRQRRELAALLELGQAINHSFDLDLLLSDGLRVLEELHLATVSTVLLVNAAADGFELHASRGVPSELIPAIQHVPLDSISGDVLRKGHLHALSADERVQMLDQYGIREHFRHQSSVYMPLIVGEKRLGVLGVGRPLDAPYADRELRLLDALASQLAQAVAKAQMYQALEETAELNAKLYLEAEEVRSYLNTLVHNTPDLLITLRPDMTMHVLNPERIYTIDKDFDVPLEGVRFVDFIPAHLHADVLARWQNVLHGQPERMELTLVTGHGVTVHVQLSATLIPEYGEVFMTVKDVTEQRRDEAHIRQNEKLAALGQMVAGAAHELNNPLAAILGLTQLQITGELEPAVRADLERIERAALRARSIVQQLLTFARSQRPDPQPVALPPILHETLNRLAAQIADVSAQIITTIAPNLPAASGDPDQIEQVLFNIVHNGLQALAANPADSARRLELSARQAGAMIELEIKDSGPGIAPEHMARLFEPFFTTRPVGQGTGLGLAIAHTIVQQHQGQIWITSQVGQGTTFTIQLPRAAEPVRRSSAPGAAPTALPGLRILLVEDEELVRSVVSRTLVRHRYTVDAVGSGDEALERVGQGAYDLIISDLQMPGIDGAALYERLHHTHPALRWLIMTGDTMGERSRAFLQRTGLPALPKPFTHAQLLARVAECISGEGYPG